MLIKIEDNKKEIIDFLELNGLVMDREYGENHTYIEVNNTHESFTPFFNSGKLESLTLFEYKKVLQKFRDEEVKENILKGKDTTLIQVENNRNEIAEFLYDRGLTYRSNFANPKKATHAKISYGEYWFIVADNKANSVTLAEYKEVKVREPVTRDFKLFCPESNWGENTKPDLAKLSILTKELEILKKELEILKQ